MRIFYPAILLCCLTVHAAPGKITADRVNIRNQASTKGAVIARYDKGTSVNVTAQTGTEWLELTISEAYILEKFIKDGKVTDTINFRSGPGTNFPRYGVLKAGTAVKVLGDHGTWKKIEAPQPVKGFVARRFVSGDFSGLQQSKTPAVKAAEKPAAREWEKAPAAVSAPSSGKKTADTAFGNLPVDLKSGKDVTVSGRLYPIPDNDLPTVRYALLKERNGKYAIECFVYTGNSKTYDSYANKNVKLIGDWYKVTGWDTPLMKVRKLKEE